MFDKNKTDFNKRLNEIMGHGKDSNKVLQYVYKDIKNLPPWHKIQLTKAERNGKIYEEIQELRKEKFYSSEGE